MDTLANKKILLVITKSNWGGAQAYVYALARQLQKEGADVAVALGGTGLPGAETGLLAQRLTAAGVRMITLSSFARDVSANRDIRALKELRSIVRQEGPDILHLNSSKAGGLGALAGRLEHVPLIIYTAHGWAHRESRNLLKKLLIWISSWLTIFLSHKVIVVSHRDFQDTPVFLSRRKIVVIRNGIAPFSTLLRNEARASLIAQCPGLTNEISWVMMQAELTKNKAVDIAISAFAKLRQTHGNTALVVLGEGEDREHLNQLIHTHRLSKNVFLAGFVPESRTYLSGADVFLMSSRKEGLPLALLEAGLVGLPVVATRIGGIPEVITDGKTGLLVAPGATEAVASAIASILNEPEQAKMFGKNLQERVRTDFSEESMISQTEALYTKRR